MTHEINNLQNAFPQSAQLTVIIGSVYFVLEVIKRYPEGARITKMSYGVGVPIDRLRPILEDLTSFGLVQTLTMDEEDEDSGIFYGLAPRAFEFLDTYWKM